MGDELMRSEPRINSIESLLRLTCLQLLDDGERLVYVVCGMKVIGFRRKCRDDLASDHEIQRDIQRPVPLKW